MSKPQLILIGGPTASGKSALALDIARRENGVVINADAMQVYRGLPVLTAQPEGRAQGLGLRAQGDPSSSVPHELYEIFDPSERSSAGKWLALAREAIERCVQAGRTPILAGGTGLYFKALIEGLADIPSIPEAAREAAQRLYDELGHDGFRAKLAERDPESAARIKVNDRQRLVRAYEVVAHTGKTIGEWQTQGSGVRASCFAKATQDKQGPRLVDRFEIARRLVMPEREALYAACDARFLKMMENGAVEEVRALLARGLDPALPAMKILGVREIAAYLRGACTREDAIAKAQQATRNYAKRQVTWLRGQWGADWGLRLSQGYYT